MNSQVVQPLANDPYNIDYIMAFTIFVVDSVNFVASQAQSAWSMFTAW